MNGRSAFSLLVAAGAGVASCSDVNLPVAPGAPLVTREGSAPAHLVNLNPSAPGEFLDGVSPSECFADQNQYIVDSDNDWMDNECEFRLAVVFSPQLNMSPSDGCPGGDPYWAAKYFPASGIVRLAYMPAYYRDCGAEGHNGDSEFITVEVRFDGSSNHWVFHQMWTSAHYRGSLFGFHDDDSRWWNADRTMFSEPYLGHPTIWVSQNKHANYPDPSTCNTYRDTCPWTFTARRFFVTRWRNVGSRSTDLIGCVYSSAPSAYSERCESFYTRGFFNGWNRVGCVYYYYDQYPYQTVDCNDSRTENCYIWVGTNYYFCSPGVTPYYDLLMSDKFESREGSMGPG